ncbi:MAG TPA: ATP-binding cassette domain-containing protein [Deltaproteobacteria bacterium]|nr:ATP-binding cassette domain-containing protein [Deltaproteobacteria bacterium]
MIAVDGITKYYGPKLAIDGISFEVKQGEILGFLGPNGAGKSTTMKIITAFMPPTTGRVTVMGYDTVDDSLEVRKRTGYLPENNPLYTDMKVESFLRFVASAKNVKRKSIKASVDNVIMECGLEEVRGRIISRLSRGYRQRVGLAQALINDPPVLILDEPTIGLDPRQIYEIRQLIKDLSGSRSIILSSHILPEVSQLCDRVAIINRGKIVAIDTPSNLTAQLSNHRIIELLVGERMDDALDLVKGIEGVVNVSRLNSHIVIETSRDMDIRPVIARKIVEAGIPLMELHAKEMSLEDIFMELVTEEEV